MRPASGAIRAESSRARSGAGWTPRSQISRTPSPLRGEGRGEGRVSGGRLARFSARPLGFGRRRLIARRSRFLGRIDRSPQRFHEVHDLGRLRYRGRFDDLSVDLRLDDLHDRLAVLVLVAAGIERVGRALDEGFGHLELLGVDLDVAFESFQAFAVLNLVFALRAPALVADRRLVIGAELAKGNLGA